MGFEWGFNHEIDHEHISDLIEELEHNFIKYKSDKHISDDGMYEFLHGKGLEALWKLVPKLGDTKPAKYLVWSLPTSGILFDNNVIEEVIKSLPKKLAIYLLERNDFYMFDLRERISKEKSYDDEIKTAAISKLKEPKISRIAKQEKRETIKSLALIGLFVTGLACIFLNVHNWITYICIGIPVISWAENSIKQFFNNKIDDIASKVDKKIKRRLNSIKRH